MLQQLSPFWGVRTPERGPTAANTNRFTYAQTELLLLLQLLLQQLLQQTRCSSS